MFPANKVLSLVVKVLAIISSPPIYYNNVESTTSPIIPVSINVVS